MRKYINLIFALVVVNHISFSQTDSLTVTQSTPEIGIKIGVTRSNIRLTDEKPLILGGNVYSLDFLSGHVINPSIAVYVKFLKTDFLNLESEVVYTRKGTSRTYEIYVTTEEDPDGTNGTRGTFATEIGLQYLQLNLNAQPKLPVGNSELYVTIGPTFNFLLAATDLERIGDQPKSFQVGYASGVGYDLNISTERNILFELKYAGDFSHFYEASFAKYWNQTIALYVGTKIF